MKKLLFILGIGTINFFAIFQNANAAEQIIHPYQSIRTTGMGGVVLTTGLYDQNFFGNPARVTANPHFKIQIFNVLLESTFDTFSAVGDIIGASDVLKETAKHAGKNLHGRLQTSFPSVYIPNDFLSLAIGLLTSSQFDLDLRQSYQIDSLSVIDIGPAVTLGRTFLDHSLAVGATAHIAYRLSSPRGFSIIDLIQGTSISPTKSGGNGTHLDFDLGTTYQLPLHPFGIDLTAAAAINNVLGGKFKNLGLKPISDIGDPLEQPRTLGFGMSAQLPSLWILDDFVLAFEVRDIGNNSNGSLFRTLHLGSEVRVLGFLLPRIGISQGYLSAGLGIDLPLLKIDLSTYGEELSLDPGGFEDRRVALRISIEI